MKKFLNRALPGLSDWVIVGSLIGFWLVLLIIQLAVDPEFWGEGGFVGLAGIPILIGLVIGNNLLKSR